MFEKVNPAHPDKVADRIGGAIVDYAYSKEENPRIAGEAMIGHGKCHIILETSVEIPRRFAEETVRRIAGAEYEVVLDQVSQDARLANNQKDEIRCGDNGVFRGMPITGEQRKLIRVARKIYEAYPYDGKYILDGNKLIVCQSNAKKGDLKNLLSDYPDAVINPIGHWTGSPSVDTGCVNRKLGSDMADSITGGGLHFKDLSKADVSANIACFLMAQKYQRPIELSCAIGDSEITGIPYARFVDIAKKYIRIIGGFEKFAEWGFLR